MRNLSILVNRGELRSRTYRVSRSSGAYSFFSCEFHSLPEDLYGNLIVPSFDPVLEDREEKGVGFFQALKDKLLKKDESVTIPIRSKEHMFFTSEFQHSMDEDPNHNIIVSEDEYPKAKTR